MISITDPANLIMLFLQCVILGIPLSILAFGIFYILRKIPSRAVQCILPLVAGTIAAAWYTAMDPSNPGKFGLLMFIVGVFIHPLLVLAPITFMQDSLHRIPVLYAVFFATVLSLFCIFGWGLLQGDMKYEGQTGFLWQTLISILTDLLIASSISGLIIGVDKIYPAPEIKNR
jgi:hypothetical protein